MARESGKRLADRLRAGDHVYVLGLCTGAHDTGASLLELDSTGSFRVVSNYEEDRLNGTRNCMGLPRLSLAEVIRDLESCGLQLCDLHAVLVTYDYSDLLARSLGLYLGEAAGSPAILMDLLYRVESKAIISGLATRRHLKRAIGFPDQVPVIGVPHHDAHAWLSYAASPFMSSTNPTLVGVIDATGDLSSISFYRAHGKQLDKVYENASHWDSLGHYYAAMTSALGGWPMGVGEGRLMGAAAWGCRSREDNRYYRALREVFRLSPDGHVFLNRDLANWQRRGFSHPFREPLRKILGDPILPSDHWSPERALNFEPHEMDAELCDRLDKIAAVQLVLEDALIHLVKHFLMETSTSQLVLTGGVALNCVANKALLDAVDSDHIEQCVGATGRIFELWIPPIPGDAGVQIGAAYAFGVRNGANLSNPIPQPYCSGRAPTLDDVSPFVSDTSVGVLELVESRSDPDTALLADLMGHLIADGLLVGLYQGRAELGLRALGNRSILADPRRREIRDVLNRRVKFREVFRPFAPIATLEAAREWFDLPEGACAGNYDALAYMTIAVDGKPKALGRIPAVFNHDGTARIQLVRPSDNPLAHGILRALGRRTGLEIAINTSLNVQTPIVGSVEQAVAALKRSSGLEGLVVVTQDGPSFLIWHNIVGEFKDAGSRLVTSVKNWKMERAGRS